MDPIIQALTDGAVKVINQLYAVLGQALGAAVVVTLLSWLAVERLTPRDWEAWKNRTAAAGIGLAMTVLAHLAVPQLSYGPGARGVAAAIFYGILGGGAAWPFHDYLAHRILAPLLRPSGASPAAPNPGGG